MKSRGWRKWKSQVLELWYFHIFSVEPVLVDLFCSYTAGIFMHLITSQDVLEMLLAPIQMSILWFTSTRSVLVESTTSTISRSVSSWSHHETFSFRSWCWTSKTFIEDTKARMRIQKSPRRISLQATSVLKRFVMQLCSAQKSCWIKSWWMKSMDSHVGICYFFQALI